MKTEGQMVGVLSCLSRTKQKYTEGDIGLAESLANMATIAIQNASLHEEAQKSL
jgi:GAF domain-containing protein